MMKGSEEYFNEKAGDSHQADNEKLDGAKKAMKPKIATMGNQTIKILPSIFKVNFFLHSGGASSSSLSLHESERTHSNAGRAS